MSEGSAISLTIWNEPITQLEQQLTAEFGAYVRLAGEIECFMGEDLRADDPLWEGLSTHLKSLQLPIDSIGKETDAGQFEFRLKPTTGLQAADDIDLLKREVKRFCDERDRPCSFAPMMPNNTSSCGLHMHLHLVNTQGQHVYFKKENELSSPLKYSLGGLMATMCDLILCFAPRDESFERLTCGSDYVPQTVSWGGNNRTVALRLPESVVAWRHIEHRVAGSDANPYAATWAMLVGVHHGLRHKIDPGEQMYGKASEPRYGLKRLPATHKEAEILFSGSEIAAAYGNENIRRELFMDSIR